MLRNAVTVMPGLKKIQVFTSKGESCSNIGYSISPLMVDEGWMVR